MAGITGCEIDRMSFPYRPFVFGLALLPVFGQARSNMDGDCLPAIRLAADRSGVAYEILLAVALTESGRSTAAGITTPSPWALNQGGESLWYDSRSAALAGLDALLAQGHSNIDIGCFQLNWHWHGSAFPSAEAMIDPKTNALYAANFLRDLHDRTGSWEQAIAAYHSATPDLAQSYMARFMPIYAAVLDDTAPLALSRASEPEQPRENSYQLLKAGGATTPGSLVPSSQGLRPLFGGS